MNSSKNIFCYFLSRLGVKHTSFYAEKLFNEHPHKYNLFGLSDLLTTYNISNSTFKLNQKEDIFTIATPFVAQVGGDFSVVTHIDAQNVHYKFNDKAISLARHEFINICTGIVLLAQPDKNSVEPNYRQNAKKETINTIFKYVAIASICTGLLLTIISSAIYKNSALSILLILNLTGIFVSFLLLQKHWHIRGGYGDKICSLFKQSDCNDILESDAATFLGIMSWSEIGFGYFFSNAFLLLFFPELIPWMAIINMAVLPYSFWSIWYQGFKAKQWCPLCIGVQVLLWSIFWVNLLFKTIHSPQIDISTIVVVGLLYGMPLLILHVLTPLLTNKQLSTLKTQELNSFKANEQIFKTLLEDQSHYEVPPCFSKIVMGNPESKIVVTVLTNPHCNPCARMHKRIEDLLTKNKEIQIQYIFSSFSSDLEISAQFLIATYLQKDVQERSKIYAEWFENGKFNKEIFFAQYPVNLADTQVVEELDKHKAWIQNSQLRATPTLLVNGYKLPESYQVEDLIYFTDLEFEI